MIRSWRAAAGVFVAGLAGAVSLAAPASADVTVDPAVAARGGPAEVAFRLPEERAGAHTTKVELVPPVATPIAEIYPMSVADWAPMISGRKLDQPVELIHGSRTTQVVAKITWTRVAGAVAKPGQDVVLTVSMGPMPQADRVAFTLVQTYSDGTVVRWADPPAVAGARPKHPAAVVTLVELPPRGGQHGGPVAGGETRAGGPSAATPAEKSGGGGLSWLLGAALLVGLVFVVEAWIAFRLDRRTPDGAGTSPPTPARVGGP